MKPPEAPDEAWEKQVREIAERVQFPPTPDIAGAVRSRLDARRTPLFQRAPVVRLAQPVAVVVLMLVLVLLLVPDLRARAFDWLHVGAVRISEDPPPATQTPFPGLLQGYDVTPMASILDWEYQITLAEAQERVAFPIPTVPSLGPPDVVLLYELEDPIVILVWEQPDSTPISLHLIGSRNRLFKYQAEVELETEVNGQRALWLSDPHLYEIMPQDGAVIQRYIHGSVLLWEADGVTYRLEGALTLDEARDLAEGLQ